MSGGLTTFAELLATIEWHERAACRGRGREVNFFPERGEQVLPAKLVCDGCPVKAECLAAGIDEHFGIWGGLSERGRRGLRKERPKGPRPIRHGSPWGADVHRKRGEKPCGECLAARNEYQNEYRRVHGRAGKEAS